MTQVFLSALSDPIAHVSPVFALKEELEKEGVGVTIARSVMSHLSPREKAEEFNRAMNENYDWILDISGGDLANTVLPWIDFDACARSSARFAGFSDLSCIVNALASQTERGAWLFQAACQSDFHELAEFLKGNQTKIVMDPALIMTKADPKIFEEGFYLGGNIRCFLKLAGTSWWPCCKGSILFLESLGASRYSMVSLLAQLKEMGVFDQVEAILFGVFNQVFAGMRADQILHLLEEILHELDIAVPFGFTTQIGHIQNARALAIRQPHPAGEEYDFMKEENNETDY